MLHSLQETWALAVSRINIFFFDCEIHLGTDRVWNEMAEHQTDQQGMGGAERGLEPGKPQCGGWRSP